MRDVCVLLLAVVIVLVGADGRTPALGGDTKTPARDAAPLTLGGVAIGGSILDTIQTLGLPNAVSSIDEGQWWQWNGPNGFDREVVTNDDLVVKEVLVAPIAATSAGVASPPPEPVDVPVLGLSLPDATKKVRDLGAAPLPSIVSTPPHAWRLHGGVLVAELSGSTVWRIRAFDNTSARMSGYLQPQLARPHHHAPVLVNTFIPQILPQGSGTVLVRVEVDVTGKVSGARVIVSSHDSAVDDWELSAIKRATFQPAQCDGNPCPGVYIDVGGITR